MEFCEIIITTVVFVLLIGFTLSCVFYSDYIKNKSFYKEKHYFFVPKKDITTIEYIELLPYLRYWNECLKRDIAILQLSPKLQRHFKYKFYLEAFIN